MWLGDQCNVGLRPKTLHTKNWFLVWILLLRIFCWAPPKGGGIKVQ